MAKERRDSKNRILRPGEYQKADGRYMYRYKDINNEDRYVYSWTLTQSDRVPPGKSGGKCLRELEKEVAKDLHDGIDKFLSEKETLNDRFDRYITTKRGLKDTTRQVYRDAYNLHVRNAIGNRVLASLKYSQMYAFYCSLVDEKGLQPSTLNVINNAINPVFKIAIRENLIRNNPQTGIMSELVKEYNWKQKKRHALTIEEQKIFFEYIKNHKNFYVLWPILTVAIGTGCRVGELVSLTWDDCDFTNNMISINHALVQYRNPSTGDNEPHITTPKTETGVREIPMLPEVKKVLLEEKKRQLKEGFSEEVIDGFSGFVFMDRRKRVYRLKTLSVAIGRAVKLYNEYELECAEDDDREPHLLPHFTIHNLRHTFCTRLCENETNLKVVQEIMGHVRVTTTMDVYNEATRESKKLSFGQLEGKIVIGQSN